MHSKFASEEVDFDPFADGKQLSQVVPSTESQREIWASVQMSEKSSCAFNESITLEFNGQLQSPALLSALQYLVNRHDALRTTFTVNGDSLCVSESVTAMVTELSGDETTYQKVLETEANTEFDLENGPLIRFILISQSEHKSWLVLSAHHIICDGWSLAILVNDLSFAYNKALAESTEIQADAYSYALYSKRFAEQVQASDDEKFWHDLYQGSLPNFDFPAEHERPAFRTFEANRLDFDLDPQLIDAVKKLAGKQGVSLTAFLLSAFYTCLSKWSGEEDLVVGLPAASQAQYDSEGLVGHCVNFLPLRMGVGEQQPFSELLANVSNLILDAYEHQNYTYGSLLKSLTIERDPARIPLCPLSFNVDQGIQGDKLNFQGLEVSFHSNPRAYENFEIFINASDYGDKFVLECQYNSNLFSAVSMTKRLQEYCQVLTQLVANVELTFSATQLLDERQNQIMVAQHSGPTNVGELHALVDLFDQQAQQVPESIALICGDDSRSYKQLEQQSNQIAAALIQQGVIQGSLVGVCLERSADLLTILLGVMKAGAGYVPLDPEYPVERLNFMLEDAGLQYLIAQNDFIDCLIPVAQPILVESLLAESSKMPLQRPDVVIDSDAVCYVIYTSGSTGKPKGVMVPNASVSNFLLSMAKKPGISATDTLLAVTTLSFDIAVLELYLPLISGAKVVLASRDQVVDGNKLKTLLTQHEVTMMQATPATWRMLCNAQWQGHETFKILCGGEALPQDLSHELLNRSGQLWNMYGPTETTVWSSCHLLNEANTKPSIGCAIANTQLYVLDQFCQLVPDGIAGELYIGGAGVTLGYLNRGDLTDERFVKLGFAGNDRLYRTGDKVLFNAKGELEYLGRLDNQIKLRGFRIELGEIETAIRQHDSVKDCALTVQEKSTGDERLIGFLVATQGSIDNSAIRELLAQTLPAYMIPQHFKQLDSLPTTPNGKLDRKALPIFKFSGQERKTYVEARTATERMLVADWKEVLSLNTLSIDDNFFDLGGHSLLIAKVIQKIEQEQSILLQYRDIFDNPSIEKLAALIDNKAQAGKQQLVKPITPRQNPQSSVLSLAQQRLWYLDKMEPNTAHFNLPSAFKFLGKLDVTALQTAFTQLISRHEVLRTSVQEHEESPVQYVHEENDFSLPLSDLSGVENSHDSLEQKLNELQASAFDINQAPLFKAELITLAEEEHVLFFMPHHLIFDGWSFDVFVHELTTLYSQNVGHSVPPLVDLPVQYGDYAIWLRELVSSHELDTQLDYWRDHLQGTLPVLQMPLDYKRADIASSRGAEIHFEIDGELFKSLEDLAKTKEVSFFMLLMTSYLTLLYRYTGQTDLTVGAPMADRTRPGTENLIGFFVNALVLRFALDPEQSFSDLLTQVKEVCLSGFSNQDVPFETLVEQVNPVRDLSHAPLFQTSVTYQDVTAREQSMADIEIQQVEIPTTHSPLDINIWFKRRGDSIVGAVVYNTELFHGDTIGAFVANFQQLLKSVAHSWHDPIAQLDILTAAEIKQVTSLHNDTDLQWPEGHSIQDLFTRQASVTPTAIAAVCGDQQITYQDLSARSNQLAHYLTQQGVKPGHMVGLCLERSIDMMVALLAVLKSGCCYIPLDPEFPQERLNYMVTDSGLKCLITQQQFASVLPQVDNTVLLDELETLLVGMPSEELDITVDTDSLAYVIYTSGSTGNPKGVKVQHGAVVNFLQSMAATPGLTAEDKLVAVTTLSFDIAVLELYLPLIVGATTVIATKLELSDGRRLLGLIKKQEITVMQATPATWRMLLAAGWDEQHQLKALCGGEALPADLAAQLLPRTSALWNMYGPTETTVWSSCCLVTDADKELSIGTPIANTRFYILDQKMNPVPASVAGELYISGAGVTHGYLNNKTMTDERFLHTATIADELLYRTGDKVRYRVDGSLEYISRIDQQVKVRGYRIELGEIEAALRGHEAIADCVVSVVEARAGDARLVAYVVWQAQTLTMTELRQHCRSWLPAYMIPQHLVDIASIPKTPNGKVDRNKLPEVFSAPAKKDEFFAPESREQKWLAEVWQEIIDIEQVGKFDNFFELGGHSLLSMQVIHKIEEASDVVINPRELLLDTLEQIASRFKLKDDSVSLNSEGFVPEKPEKGFFGRLLNR